jgi:hypothetical protein
MPAFLFLPSMNEKANHRTGNETLIVAEHALCDHRSSVQAHDAHRIDPSPNEDQP